MLGKRAVELLRDGVSGQAVGVRDNHVINLPIGEVLGQQRVLMQI